MECLAREGRIPMTLAIGVVVAQSATRFSATALDTAPERIWRTREETPLEPDRASVVIERLVREIEAEAHVDDASDVAVCCALEADLDASRERVLALRHAPGWHGAALRDALARRLRRTVSLATLTEAAAVAEIERGSGRGSGSMLYLLPARGVTACLIEHDQILRGAHGMAGTLDRWPTGETGAFGRLGVVASAQAIVRAMIGRASASDESTEAMLRVSGGRAEAMTAAQVVALATQGDPAARAVIEDASDALARALGPLVLMLDPGVIIIGGALALAAPLYLDMVNERLRALLAGGADPPAVALGQMEPMAALTGAGLLASRLRP
jgi:glucokinase